MSSFFLSKYPTLNPVMDTNLLKKCEKSFFTSLNSTNSNSSSSSSINRGSRNSSIVTATATAGVSSSAAAASNANASVGVCGRGDERKEKEVFIEESMDGSISFSQTEFEN